MVYLLKLDDIDRLDLPRLTHVDNHNTFSLFIYFMLGPGQASTLDLGMVNELQVEDEGDDDETRQALGDKEGTAQKWHQHTVKVLQMLQRTIGDDNEHVQEVSYDALSKNCSRRTAASVFFELLQLKTWDFIEIDQQDPYGDIEISAGVRFQEAPPNAK
jgi:cohesin complex subunit SCC1